jgi:hypothetical protein
VSYAVCKSCKKVMGPNSGCIAVRGEPERVPHSGSGKCPDCYVAPGRLHHFGCDQERCPKCGCQLIGCDCDAESN